MLFNYSELVDILFGGLSVCDYYLTRFGMWLLWEIFTLKDFRSDVFLSVFLGGV